MSEQKEWKIKSWWMKLFFIMAAIGGAINTVAFIIGFIIGMMGL